MNFFFLQSIKAFVFILLPTSNSFANPPRTPSPGYNNDYYYTDRLERNIDEQLINQIPIRAQKSDCNSR